MYSTIMYIMLGTDLAIYMICVPTFFARSHQTLNKPRNLPCNGLYNLYCSFFPLISALFYKLYEYCMLYRRGCVTQTIQHVLETLKEASAKRGPP
jgi:hypothetical protein